MQYTGGLDTRVPGDYVDLESLDIPKLPGLAMHDPYKRDFKKAHQFDTVVSNGEVFKQIDAYNSRKAHRSAHQASVRLHVLDKSQPAIPAWVAFANKVLKFDCYFQEHVTESAVENYRVHRCNLFFYLEDDSLHISEPAYDDSGLPHGVLLVRHQVPRPAGPGDRPGEPQHFYGVQDLVLGSELEMYGRVYKLTDCNPFTRKFLSKYGFEVGTPQPTPSDPYTELRAKSKIRNNPNARDSSELFKLKQFLENDRKVLRFFCIWDDRTSLYGEQMRYILHYFLADDTVEILEVQVHNSGRDPFPSFMKRQKLAKSESMVGGLRTVQYYGPTDIVLGSTINVLGRPFFLYDCDEFTYNYYANTHSDIPLTRYTVDEPPQPEKPLEIPQKTGFGSDDDSLSSFLFLTSRVPRKFATGANSGQPLRFSARFWDRPADADRRFVITFFLDDLSVSVFEPPVKNSGIMGGRYLERGRVTQPGSEKYYELYHLFPGNVVEFHSSRFLVLDTDLATQKFLDAEVPQWKEIMEAQAREREARGSDF